MIKEKLGCNFYKIRFKYRSFGLNSFKPNFVVFYWFSGKFLRSLDMDVEI